MSDSDTPAAAKHISEETQPPPTGIKAIAARWNERLDRMNVAVNASWFGRFFQMEERRSCLTQELRAGLVCFLTVAYIIPVNAGILSDSGGSCDPAVHCNPERYEIMGDLCRFDDPVTNPEWAQCIMDLRANLISATCIASCIGTFLMALVANFPAAVAPAMGVNAYFTYTVVGFMATGRISYQAALAAAFVEGFIFIFLSIVGLRSIFMELIPRNLLYATATGIGCFLAFIGLQKSEGLAIVTYDGATLVTIGGCLPPERFHMYSMNDENAYWHDLCWNAWRDNVTSTDLSCGTCGPARDYFFGELGLSSPMNLVEGCQEYVFSFNPEYNLAPGVQLGLPPRSANYGCLDASTLRSATMWLGIMGGMLMVLLMIRKFNAAILVGILFVTFIAWIPTESNKATYFTEHSEIPGGEARFEYFKKGATVPELGLTAGQLDFSALSDGETWVALITFLYLDFMDATSTMFAMASLVNEALPGFLDKRGAWPRQVLTMVVDGTSIVIGSTLGTSPLTVFAESGVGIRSGGRTGITAAVVALGFGVSMFLAPIFASIPPYATGPAIVFVGALMFEHARHIDWTNVRSAIPAFITIICMPLTYSIAYGIIAGIMIQIFLWLACWVLEYWDCFYKKDRTLRHVWLNNTDMFYRILRKEDVLIRDLPGYKPVTSFDDKAEIDDADDHHPENPGHVAFPRKSKPAAPLADDVDNSDESNDARGMNDKTVA